MLIKIVVFVLGALLSSATFSQTWPQKPVRFIVPFPAGGATDVPARMLGEKLSQIWGQPVIVENRPGAGGTVGAALAARAVPDGYTLFFPSGSVMTASQYIYAKLSYDPEKDFVPVTNVVSGPQVLVVTASSPYKTVKDLIDAAKANPGKFTFGHAGIGSQTHLAAEHFVHAAKLDAVNVPYKSDPQALADLVGGTITFCVTNLSSTLSFVNAGRVRALGVTATDAVPQLPDIPPIAKTLRGFENSGWFGIVAPTGVSNKIIQKVYQDSRKVLEDPQMKSRLAALGLTPVANSPAEMGKAMKEERARWESVVKERGIQLK